MYKAILERISTTNFATLAVSCVAILTLYLVKTQINQRFKDKLKLPIPIELIVVSNRGDVYRDDLFVCS